MHAHALPLTAVDVPHCVQAQEANAQLRRELLAEHTRRKAAMDALLGSAA
jgi:hypothetical protein